MGINLLDDLRSDDLARTAPGGEAVEDNQGVLCGQSLRPVVGTVSVVSLLPFPSPCLIRGGYATYVLRLWTPSLLMVAENALAGVL